jgi:DNA-directed RNA polymerase subunit alpha
MLITNEGIRAGTLVLEPTYGRFLVENLPKGMGITLGNTLRRVLLSYIPGAAIFYVKFSNVVHEYEPIDGVKEDPIDIILNLKGVRFRYDSKEPFVKVFLNVKGPAEVLAKDIKCPERVSVINRNHYIATITTKTTLEFEAGVMLGIGYVPAEDHVFPSEIPATIGYIKVDSIFSPIVQVNYYTELERKGEKVAFEKLYLEIWTDGSITPKEALSKALYIIKDYNDKLLSEYAVSEDFLKINSSKTNTNVNNLTLKDLNLSSRALNALKRIGINTLEELLSYSEDDLLTVRNLGGKSLEEIKEKLKELGLSLKKV